jgi:8-oxo-dGTP diphosphatase
MTKTRPTVIPAVYMLFKKDDSFLLLRRFNTGYCDGQYSLPAGHLDGGETIIEAVIREATEETGVSVKPEDMTLYHVMNRYRANDGERVDFFFLTEKWEGEPCIMEKDKCDELKWCHIDELNDVGLIPYVKEMFENMKNGIMYSDTELN